MYVVRRLAQGLSIYHRRILQSLAVSRTHTPFILGASTDASSANLVGIGNEQRLGDPLGLRRHDYDRELGKGGQNISTSNELERVVEGRGEAWWKARIPEENAPKRTKLGPSRTRRYVLLTASAKLIAEM